MYVRHVKELKSLKAFEQKVIEKSDKYQEKQREIARVEEKRL